MRKDLVQFLGDLLVLVDELEVADVQVADVAQDVEVLLRQLFIQFVHLFCFDFDQVRGVPHLLQQSMDVLGLGLVRELLLDLRLEVLHLGIELAVFGLDFLQAFGLSIDFFLLCIDLFLQKNGLF